MRVKHIVALGLLAVEVAALVAQAISSEKAKNEKLNEGCDGSAAEASEGACEEAESEDEAIEE